MRVLAPLSVVVLSLAAGCNPPCAPLDAVLVCECSPGVRGTAVCHSSGLTACDCSGDGGTDMGSPPPDGGMDAGDAGGGVDAGDGGGADMSGGTCAVTWDGTIRATGVCTTSGWCATTRPPAVAYSDISASGPSDIWAVGAGAVVHFDGAHWHGVVGLDLVPSRVRATSATDAWMAGRDPSTGSSVENWHWDGTLWTRATVPPTGPALTDFTATSATDAWWVGNLGRVAHYDGTSWADVDVGAGSTNLTRVVARSSTDVWVSAAGVIRHLEAGTWVDRSFASSGEVVLVDGSGQAWANVLDGSMISGLQRWTGTTWTSVPFMVTWYPDPIIAAAASPSGEAMFAGQGETWAGYFWDGATMTRSFAGAPCLSGLAYDGSGWLGANASCHIAQDPGIYRYTPTTGTSLETGPDATDVLALGSDDDVLVRGYGGGVWRGTIGGTLTPAPDLVGHRWPLAGNTYASLWALSPTGGAVEHWNGSTWSTTFVDAGGVRQLSASDVTTAFAVLARSASEPDMVYRFNGVSWSLEMSAPIGVGLTVVATGSGRAYVLGASGATMGYFDGISWTGATQSFDVACAGPTDSGELDVVATDGTFFHLAGTTMTLHPSPPAGTPTAGCIVRNGRALVGDAYFDGTSWRCAAFGGSDRPPQFRALGPGGRAWAGRAFPGWIYDYPHP